jgi:hypothetical protein
MISELVEKFKGLLYGERKNEVEGYLLMNDNTKTLLLVKEGEKSWKTKWFNSNEIILKTPEKQLETVFKKST